nr:MAG TPA: tail-collar fiber protein [Caudoviricetes sp.]
MASFQSTVTDKGRTEITRLLAAGGRLNIVQAKVGDGVAQVSPNTLTELISPIEVHTEMGEPAFVEGSPAVLRVPVQVTNQGLAQKQYVREVGLYALDGDGQQYLFAVSWLDGGDGDNVLTPPAQGEYDTVHIHDVGIFVTNDTAGIIQIQVGAGSFVTLEQVTAYFAAKDHTQAATTVLESVGKNTEEVQRQQDFEIQSLKEQLGIGFVGTEVVHTFAAEEIDQWYYYGDKDSVYFEGTWEPEVPRIYA